MQWFILWDPFLGDLKRKSEKPKYFVDAVVPTCRIWIPPFEWKLWLSFLSNYPYSCIFLRWFVWAVNRSVITLLSIFRIDECMKHEDAMKLIVIFAQLWIAVSSTSKSGTIIVCLYVPILLFAFKEKKRLIKLHAPRNSIDAEWRFSRYLAYWIFFSPSVIRSCSKLTSV